MASRKKISATPLAIDKPVVLVGLMGAGKTTIGRRLASSLDLPFVDSDHEIVEAAGCSIADIFAIYGEEIFRDVEERVLLRLVKGKNCVIATGGGAFMNDTIRSAILKHSWSVWLKADLPVLVERVSRRDTRPLLRSGDKEAILGKLMDERYPTYSQADIIIDSNDDAHEVVVQKIVTALQEKLANG